MRKIAFLATALAISMASTAHGSPLDKPYTGVAGNLTCGNELKLASLNDKGGEAYQRLDVLLVGEGIRNKPLPPVKYTIGMAVPPQKLRSDGFGYMLKTVGCQTAGGAKTVEVKLGIKEMSVKRVLHYGSRIAVHKDVIAEKPQVTTCLPNMDGKRYHYRGFWGVKDDKTTPVLVLKRPEGNPGCFTDS